MFLVPSCSCLCPIYWSHVLSRERRCSSSNSIVDDEVVCYRIIPYVEPAWYITKWYCVVDHTVSGLFFLIFIWWDSSNNQNKWYSESIQFIIWNKQFNVNSRDWFSKHHLLKHLIIILTLLALWHLTLSTCHKKNFFYSLIFARKPGLL